MVSPSFSKISQNDKEAMDLAPPATGGDSIYADTHIRGTVFSTCRSRFRSAPYIVIAVTGFIMIMIAAISWSFIPRETNTQQPHENAGFRPMSPQPVDWDVIQKQTWGNVDIDRPSKKFRAEFVSGGTYTQKSALEIKQVFPLNGKEHSSLSYMDVENTMFVSDSSNVVVGGGKQFDITLNHVAMTQKSMGIEVKYDSEKSDNESNLLSDEFGDLVGQTATINTDGNYQIIRTSSDTGSQETEESSASSVTPSSQFELVSRMIKALPVESAKPGDEWDIQINLESFEEIDGHAQLLGYIQYDGADCALIIINGTVAFDMSALVEGVDAAASELGIMQMKDGKMSSVMYWDHQENLARFTEINLSFTLQNPYDASTDFSDSKDGSIDPSFIDVPTFEYMQIYLERNE